MGFPFISANLYFLFLMELHWGAPPQMQVMKNYLCQCFNLGSFALLIKKRGTHVTIYWPVQQKMTTGHSPRWLRGINLGDPCRNYIGQHRENSAVQPLFEE